MDSRLRFLEQQALSGDSEDYARYLRELLRVGLLTERRVILAAEFGHPGALLLYPHIKPRKTVNIPWHLPAQLYSLDFLGEYNYVPLLKNLALDMVEHALPIIEDQELKDILLEHIILEARKSLTNNPNLGRLRKDIQNLILVSEDDTPESYILYALHRALSAFTEDSIVVDLVETSRLTLAGVFESENDFDLATSVQKREALWQQQRLIDYLLDPRY